jgi:type II secretory pathway component GspD/PulD (secretin)
LEDTVASLNQVLKTIRSIEDNEKGQADTVAHECKYIKAQDAERILKELLGDPLQLSRMASTAGEAKKPRLHFITSDEKLNKVLVTGPPDKLSQAQDILKRIDVPQQEGDKPLLVGPPVLTTYPVPSGNAEAIVKILQDNYKQSTTVRITTVNDSSIMAWAGPGDQFDIARLISGSGGSGRKTERIELTNLNVARIVDTIRGIFGEGKTGAPFIEAQPETNALVVNGTTEQITEIKAVLKAIGDMGTGNLRVFTLETGSTRTLAEVLKEALEKQGRPVRLIKPEDLLAPGAAGREAIPAPPSEKKGPGPSSHLPWPRTPGILVAQAGPGGSSSVPSGTQGQP